MPTPQLPPLRIANARVPATRPYPGDGASPKSAHAGTFGTRAVLVVDPYDEGRRAVAELLREYGYAVLESATGEEGLRLARACRPSLIIVELWPFFSGAMLMVEQLRGEEEISRIPILVMTAAASAAYQRRAMQLGCDGYLEKPCAAQQVLSEVSRIVRFRNRDPGVDSTAFPG